MRIGRLSLILLTLILLGSCVLPDRKVVSSLPFPNPGPHYSARLNIFLVLRDDKGPAIRLEVSSLEVLSDGLWRPLTRGSVTIDSTKIGSGQLYLGGEGVPPGRYQRLRMTVTGMAAQKAGGELAAIDTAPFVVEMDLSSAMTLERQDSRTILLTWDVENSLRADNTVQPVIAAAPAIRQQLLDLVFVACPDIDTVFVVRADKNWVIDSFGLKGRPTYLALDPVPSRQRLFVLTPGDRTVKVVDLSSYRVVDYFPVPLNDTPTFMTISPDGDAAFLLDENSGYLSRMELTTGRISARSLLGYQPSYSLYLDGQNLLAVSLSLSQRVLLLDPTTFAVVGTLSTGSTPAGMTVSEGNLYIAENDDNTVSVVDLTSRSTLSRLSVGLGPRRLQGVDDQIYASNYLDDSLSVLVPGQFGVIQQTSGLLRPQEMAFDQVYRRLYVTEEEAGALAVVDTNTNLLVGHIFLGARPLGMVVVQ